MKNLYFLILIYSLSIYTNTATAQDPTVNFGYIPDTEYYSGGIAFNGYEVDLMISDEEDVEGYAIRAGYMATLLSRRTSNLYVGPRIGYKYENVFGESNSTEGLFYEAAAGFHLSNFNFSLGYGYDQIAETEYVSLKFGIPLPG
ncbi:hypothetical protein [Rhodohalobacter sp.]|uniref:hypothetical protein n=1 Tax=Rhodohalobacter sp. TaxID=1974210 RepID=UPI003564DB73